MSQIWTRVVVVVLGVITAALCGIAIGNAEYIAVAAAAGMLILFALLFVLWPRYLPEAKILAFLLTGHVVFQRWFADQRVSIIFITEAALAIAGALVLLRLAFQRFRAFPRHNITWPIALLLILGTARFVLVDFGRHGLIDSARDFAVVYYTAFYFIGYAVGIHQPSRELIMKWFYRATTVYLAMILPLFFILMPLGILATFTLVLSTRDMAVIVPTYATLLLGVAAVKSRRLRWYMLAVIPLAWLIYLRARAGYVAFGFTSLVFLAAISHTRRDFLLRISLLTAATVVIGGIIFIGSELTQVRALQPFVREVESIFDVAAIKERKSAAAGDATDYSSETSRWRAAWWQAVFDETMQRGPIFGLGFGYNLANKFNREYYGRTRGEAAARNPHNVAFTFLGRLGLTGLALFIWLCVSIVRQTFRVVGAIRRRDQPLENINPWLVVLSVLFVGLFSHSFEGPMAAVPFWSLLGLGVAQQVLARRAAAAAAAAAPAPQPARPEQPVRRPALAGAGSFPRRPASA
jgi:hypothetical protein